MEKEEKKISGKIEKDDQGPVELSDAMPELSTLEDFLKKAIFSELEISGDYLLLMVRVIQKKLQHFTDKYDFKVDWDDLYYIENFCDHIEFKEHG